MTALEVSRGEYLKGVHSAVIGDILDIICMYKCEDNNYRLLDGMPHLCGTRDDDMTTKTTTMATTTTTSKCYSYNSTLDSWEFSGRYGTTLNLPDSWLNKFVSLQA